MLRASPLRPPRRSWRWLVFILLAVVLHLLTLDWATGVLQLPNWPQKEPVIAVQLLPQPASKPAAQAAASAAAPHEAEAPRPPKPSKPHSTRAAAPADAPQPQPETAPEIAEQAPQGMAGMEVPGTSVEAGIDVDGATNAPAAAISGNSPTDTAKAEPPAAAAPPTAAAPAAPAQEPPAAEFKPTQYVVKPPPSAELSYTVTATREGQLIHGSGKINWLLRENEAFDILGQVDVLFLNMLTFKSQGKLDRSGIAPRLYSEKVFRKSETNTHFHPERNTISFSASTNSYPRVGGEQDRASIVWQVAGIARGDSSQIQPGAVLQIMVAGTRDAEVWQLRVIGEEQIELADGPVTAWHIRRTPRPGSYDKSLDIWLAPQQEWYPVRLRYTDNKGDYLDMAVSAIRSNTAH